MIKNKDEQQVLFMGDSTMFRLWREARAFQNGEPLLSKIITTGRCNWLRSFGIKPSKVWRKPNPKKEGPALYGLENPWCTDCSGCSSYVVFPKGKKLKQKILGTHFLTMDYIAVEFARDVEMQSVYGNTTQETLSRYLQLQFKTYSVCVLNEGIHDQRLHGFMAEDYVLNVMELLELFVPVCLNIIWIEMTAPRGDEDKPQTKVITQEWNIALYSYLNNHRHPNVSLMRVFNQSLKAMHKDNVHMHQSWYEEMARTMFGRY